jgi:hypothetical protein
VSAKLRNGGTQMKRIVIVFFFVLTTITPTYAQEKSISLGGTDLRLGMTVEQVIKALDSYDVRFMEKDRANSSAVVDSKGNISPVGIIEFTAGKLTWVSIERESYSNPEAVSLAKSLFSLLSLASEDGKKVALAGVSTKHSADSDESSNFVIVSVGSKTILVQIWDLNLDMKKRTVVTIKEKLGEPRPKK